MYFPFLYGKENELYALAELSGLITESQNIVPIIEPINTNNTTINKLNSLVEGNVPFVLIVNPLNGGLAGKMSKVFNLILDKLLSLDNISLGYYIHGKTTQKEIIDIFNTNKEQKLTFIHNGAPAIESEKIIETIDFNQERIDYQIFIDGKVSKSYMNNFSDYNKVLIQDSFKKATRNADYPQEQYFSDLYLNYYPEYYGFGDFQTIGKGLQDGGGPAHAVTLHLTIIKESDNSLWTRHFISDDTVGSQNPGGKYLQALKKLVDFVDNERIVETLGIKDFKHSYSRKHYPGLGKAKLFSIKHHIELISRNV